MSVGLTSNAMDDSFGTLTQIWSGGGGARSAALMRLVSCWIVVMNGAMASATAPLMRLSTSPRVYTPSTDSS
eukprot:2601872-Heterocapsa_arctica.AAC.1